ncbi:MAG: hypothetical protein GEV12_14950 [Micromonosporaceae bacterium]|nr:hypothetical protein [Micromonosporaceae bacterium]
MSDFVNLSDRGALTRAGQGYDGSAQDGTAESRSFQGRMDQSQQGLRGRAGMQFTGMTTQHAGNLVALGRQFAEQAFRAVRGEQAVVTADDDAFTTQQTIASTVDTQTSAVTRPINGTA